MSSKKQCSKCYIEKNVTKEFYVSYSKLSSDGRVSVCKTCLNNMYDHNEPYESLKSILRLIDKPYIYHIVDSSMKENPDNVFGKYMKNIGLKNYKGYTWGDSVFEPINKENYVEPNININQQFTLSTQFQLTDELIDKWGDGYTSDEYRSFERKYSMLKNNYQEKTAMHTEALLTYIRYRVKEELATAQGDSKAAKEWGTLAKDAATAAKINPSQLSKSDLSDGLDTFGQLVRTVEQAVDIIPILPRFKARPQDRGDFTLWCYVNYARDLKGLPAAEYKDIYEFYEVRKKAYEDAASNGDENGLI
ncbi:hypothetical protein [Paenibacillus sp. NAIST15-1]|uniref:hypothetical protein n=1 Tax=Paenibacillus sp. NAIST15-1 TaxID=1605994 RepID=UPI000868C763|nr:hypothetical protein [Paenibacillus sp. NAIST15-1]GAV11298.1 hypothetical protein PBN151_1225 [Paenibacillus sp. NAIST15-1]